MIPLTGEMSRSDKRVAVWLQSRSLQFSAPRLIGIVGSGALTAPSRGFLSIRFYHGNERFPIRGRAMLAPTYKLFSFPT